MRTRALVAVAAGALALAACGSDNSSSSSATQAPAAQSATTAASASTAAPATTAAASTATTAAASTATTADAGAGSYGGAYGAPPTTAASSAAAGAAAVTLADTSLGKILADTQGRTLYVFTKDSGGASACNDACAKAWPPVAVTGTPTAPTGVDPSALGTITRTDGTTQLTIKSQPLYTFAADAAPGDVNGQGSNGLWWVVSPDGSAIKS